MRHREFRKIALLACLLISAFLIPGCERSAPGEPLDTVEPSPLESEPAPLIKGWPSGELVISREGQTLLELRVEIASTKERRAEGLMGVKSMPAGAGMVFEFGYSHRGAFYMKDTLIPLDIAFWNEEGKIVDILQMPPCEAEPCPHYPPSANYVSAVEVNMGLMQASGVSIGDQITLTKNS